MAFTTPHLNSTWRVSGAGFRHAECEKARKVIKIRAKSEFLCGPGAWCRSDGRRAQPFVIRQKLSPSTSAESLNSSALRQKILLVHSRAIDPIFFSDSHFPHNFLSEVLPFKLPLFFTSTFTTRSAIMCAATSIPSPRGPSQGVNKSVSDKSPKAQSRFGRLFD